MTVRVHADIHPGKLGRTAFPAFSAHKARDHFSFPPENRHGGLSGSLGPDPHLRLDKLSESEELRVIIQRLLVFEGSPDAGSSGQVLDIFRDLKVEGIASLSEPGQDDTIARFGLFQGINQHNKGMGSAGLPADLMEVIHNLLRRSTQIFRYFSMLSLEKTGKDESIHISFSLFFCALP
jgi:hypothetical protein